jgi:hypothetical protein
VTTYTLWLQPYFCLRGDCKPLLSGLSKAKADEIIQGEANNPHGVLFLEEDAFTPPQTPDHPPDS